MSITPDTPAANQGRDRGRPDLAVEDLLARVRGLGLEASFSGPADPASEAAGAHLALLRDPADRRRIVASGTSRWSYREALLGALATADDDRVTRDLPSPL